jgi:hypothetical protein
VNTQHVTMELPHGRDWLWFEEFNIIAFSPRLDAAGRERALDECQAEWRQSLCLASAMSTAA